MRMLILGGDGMLGHQMFRELGNRHEVRVTLRQALANYSNPSLFNARNAYDNVDVCHFERVRHVMTDFRPDAVVNATGIIKQRSAASQNIPSIEINALFPHKLILLCQETATRLVHMSTDCVFSGRRGNYSESDTPDAEDIYGRSKLLGEVTESPAITLRTSIIGRELSRKTGLLEWFLAQTAPIKGFRKAIFSGFTTLEMSRIVEHILLHVSPRYGLYHVSSAPINKCDLLLLIRDKLGLNTEIVADNMFECDRSLDSSRFRRDFSYVPPTWDSMITELANRV
jgi:dTDP-4-dehydrorhamnose reductase